MIRTHEPGEAAFRSILPEHIDWKPFPAFPAPIRLAVPVEDPTQPGPYIIRVKAPSGVKMMPHKHPEDRIYTVMSGVFYVGLGAEFDGDKVKAYPRDRAASDGPCYGCSSGPPGNGEVSQLHVPRSGPDGQPIASSHLERAPNDLNRFGIPKSAEI